MTTDEQATIATLCTRVEEMRDAVTTMEATLNERCPAHLERLGVLEVELHGRPGNGQSSGILGRVLDLENVAKEMRDLKKWARATAGAIVASLAVSLIVWLVAR